MPAAYDALVVGLGAMGSATAWSLARRGLRVLGLDQFSPGHTRGSSHGESRIIRELYFEHPLYVPVLQRAYALWGELEAEARVTLLHLSGGLMLGPTTGHVVLGARESAHRHGLPYDELSAEAVAARFPAIRPPADYVGIWDRRAGYVRSDLAIEALQAVARRHGAELRYGERMTEWHADETGVTITTSSGERYQADRLVLCTGPWITQSLTDLALPLSVERQVLVWLDPLKTPDDEFAEGRFPVFVYEHRAGHTAYGFPRLPTGVKAALFHGGPTVSDADVPQPAVTAEEIAAVRATLATAFPLLAAAPVRTTASCLFTNTPDTRFVLGWHPAHPRVLLCSPCSGHGFKFTPVIGEINADFVTAGATPLDLSPFAVTRFTGGP